MITLVIPTFGGHPSNIQRTIDSCAGVVDDVVIISTCPYPEDEEHLRTLGSVVSLPWNYTYLNGFGEMMNQGTAAAKNDWLLLFGVGETLFRQHQPMHLTLKNAARGSVFRCNHINDPHRWGRIWNRRGGTRWGGLIHESIGGGQDGCVLFEMRDTPKESAGPEKDPVFRHIKATLYNAMYRRLLQHPEELNFTDPGWLNFVRGAEDSINEFCTQNQDLLSAATEGDFKAFADAVSQREAPASGVNFRPLGEPHGN